MTRQHPKHHQRSGQQAVYQGTDRSVVVKDSTQSRRVSEAAIREGHPVVIHNVVDASAWFQSLVRVLDSPDPSTECISKSFDALPDQLKGKSEHFDNDDGNSAEGWVLLERRDPRTRQFRGGRDSKLAVPRGKVMRHLRADPDLYLTTQYAHPLLLKESDRPRLHTLYPPPMRHVLVVGRVPREIGEMMIKSLSIQ